MLRLPTVEVRKTVRPGRTGGSLPHIPFERIARTILSERYELSLVICGDTLARRMNKTYRLPALKLRRAGKKSYAPNVLSFPLTVHEGEIFLNVRKAEREARTMGIALRERMAHLFVHGCLHLKGLPHGRTMDSEERRILRAFRIQWPNESTRE